MSYPLECPIRHATRKGCETESVLIIKCFPKKSTHVIPCREEHRVRHIIFVIACVIAAVVMTSSSALGQSRSGPARQLSSEYELALQGTGHVRYRLFDGRQPWRHLCDAPCITSVRLGRPSLHLSWEGEDLGAVELPSRQVRLEPFETRTPELSVAGGVLVGIPIGVLAFGLTVGVASISDSVRLPPLDASGGIGLAIGGSLGAIMAIVGGVLLDSGRSRRRVRLVDEEEEEEAASGG